MRTLLLPACSLLLSLLLVGCSLVSLPVSGCPLADVCVFGKPYQTCLIAGVMWRLGIASWYGADFHGRLTSMARSMICTP